MAVWQTRPALRIKKRTSSLKGIRKAIEQSDQLGRFQAMKQHHGCAFSMILRRHAKLLGKKSALFFEQKEQFPTFAKKLSLITRE